MKKFTSSHLAMSLCLLCWLCTSCMDETLVSTTYGTGTDASDREMRLKVAVPRSLGATGGGTELNKETTIQTLDVLVFAPGKEDKTKYYLLQAIAGKPTAGVTNTFDVVMPIGEGFDVHFFANVHADLVAKRIFSTRGTLREAALKEITQGLVATSPIIEDQPYEIATDLHADGTYLPMYGSVQNVTISKDKPEAAKMDVSVLRSVATVCVTTKATVNADKTITPGTLDEFKLREIYVYYPAVRGLIAPLPVHIDTADPDGNVNSPTLPSIVGEGTNPGGVWWKDDSDAVISELFRPKKISLTDIGLLDGLYFYENIAGENAGSNQTRIVVGGVFKEDKNSDGTPKVTYYRINLWDDAETFFPVLRNHRYIFNIQKVNDSGVDTPDAAAKGQPINIKVKVIDWKDEIVNIDYDGQYFFKAATKQLSLSRTANSKRSIVVESNCDVAEWKMSFEGAHNGATIPPTVVDGKVTPTTGTTLQNARYKVTKTATTLTVEVLKPYSDAGTPPETRDDVLKIQVKNLTVYIKLTQLDKASDDWGNGGDLDTGLGTKEVIDIGLKFNIAPANVMGYMDGGVLKYKFTKSQGDYSAKIDGGDYFNWGSATPFDYDVSNSQFVTDVCREVGSGDWRTPMISELKTLCDYTRVWGNYITSNGSTVDGWYIGTTDKTLAENNQDAYVFLTSGGFRRSGMSKVTTEGYYWSADGQALGWWNAGAPFVGGGYAHSNGFFVRCVKDI